MNDSDEFIERLEKHDLVLYRGLGSWNDEYILANKIGGRIVLNGCKFRDIERFVEEELAD